MEIPSLPACSPATQSVSQLTKQRRNRIRVRDFLSAKSFPCLLASNLFVVQDSLASGKSCFPTTNHSTWLRPSFCWTVTFTREKLTGIDSIRGSTERVAKSHRSRCPFAIQTEHSVPASGYRLQQWFSLGIEAKRESNYLPAKSDDNGKL